MMDCFKAKQTNVPGGGQTKKLNLNVDIKKMNIFVLLIITVGLFAFVFLTSYALFSSSSIGNNTLSLSLGKKDYNINIANTTGGTINSPSTGVVESSITFTPIPTTTTCTEYIYNGATITNSNTGETYLTLDNNTKSFIMPNYDITITPNWQETKQYLYKRGNECSELTGGWQMVSGGTTGGGATFTKNADYLLVANSANNYAYDERHTTTINKIDVTNYKNLKATIKIEGIYNSGGYSIIRFGVYDYHTIYSVKSLDITSANVNSITIDLSTISGERYVSFLSALYMYSYITYQIQEVWLE